MTFATRAINFLPLIFIQGFFLIATFIQRDPEPGGVNLLPFTIIGAVVMAGIIATLAPTYLFAATEERQSTETEVTKNNAKLGRR